MSDSIIKLIDELGVVLHQIVPPDLRNDIEDAFARFAEREALTRLEKQKAAAVRGE